jgi:hypothetical protein
MRAQLAPLAQTPAPFTLAGFERVVVRAAAGRTRPMPSGEGRRLVQEQQLPVLTRRHDLAVPAPKLQPTGHPGRPRPALRHPTVPVVQAPAVAHQQTAVGEHDDLTPRRHSVLQRHDILSLFYGIQFIAKGGLATSPGFAPVFTPSSSDTCRLLSSFYSPPCAATKCVADHV